MIPFILTAIGGYLIGSSLDTIIYDKGGKITSARITEMPKTLFDPMPKIFVMVDGKEEFLFEYYPDEISFTPKELVGLTVLDAHRLKIEKDKRFLRGE